jgi:hypothetical protein
MLCPRRRFLRKITHPTARQPRYVFDALHVAEFHFYFRLCGLGGTFLVSSYASWWLCLPFTLRGIDGKKLKY